MIDISSSHVSHIFLFYYCFHIITNSRARPLHIPVYSLRALLLARSILSRRVALHYCSGCHVSPYLLTIASHICFKQICNCFTHLEPWRHPISSVLRGQANRAWASGVGIYCSHPRPTRSTQYGTSQKTPKDAICC